MINIHFNFSGYTIFHIMNAKKYELSEKRLRGGPGPQVR
jgi:hypothetical protein